MQSYLRAMRNYAGFQGRASRAEFWLFTLFATLIVVVATAIGIAAGPGAEGRPPVLGAAVGLLHALPSLAVAVRRLHDTNRSGWWWLLNLVPLGSIVLLVWCCTPGTDGPNQFGPNPLAQGAGQAWHGPNNQVVASAPPPRADVIGEIERLAQLKANGSLSDIEFERMKAHALARQAAS